MKIVAVLSCPTGLASVFIAEAALKKAARNRGVQIKIETRSSLGVENEITVFDLYSSHIGIITKGIDLSEKKWIESKPLIEVDLRDIPLNKESIIDEAVNCICKNEFCRIIR